MKYLVPVTVEISGNIEVEANSPKEALDMAMRDYKGVDSIQYPCYETDFAYGEDVSSVEEAVEETD